LLPFCGEWYSRQLNFGLWISPFLLDETRRFSPADADLPTRKSSRSARENLYSVSEDSDDGGTAAEIKRTSLPA
jgi:hypothetical protein